MAPPLLQLISQSGSDDLGHVETAVKYFRDHRLSITFKTAAYLVNKYTQLNQTERLQKLLADKVA